MLGFIINRRTSAPKSEDEMVEGEEFPGERDVAAVSQKRHLKDLQKADKGNFIDPLGVGEKIPHFPEKAADKAAG